MYYYNLISTHLFVFCIFSCRTMNSFNKLLVIVVIPNTKQTNWLYKHHHVKTLPCFYRKLYHLFLSNAVKTENLRGIRIWETFFIIFWRLYTCNIYIVATSASDFKHLSIFYNFHPAKQTFWSGTTPYLT